MTTNPTMTVFSQVSILARSDARAQFVSRAKHEAMDEFQSSPALMCGRNSGSCRQSSTRRSFQSSPALMSGRNIGAPPVAPASQVSILARSDERAQSGTRDADFLPLRVSILARSDERAQ